MPEPDISSGVRAWERNDWAAAYEELRPLLDTEDGAAEPLEALAESAWWCGRVDDTIAASERAFAAYTELGRNVDAARVATGLAEHHAMRLQPSASRAWMVRAAALLEDEPPTAALGHLRRLEAVFASGSEGGLQEAIKLSVQVEDIGKQTGDRDVEVLGRHDQGRFSIAAGDLQHGMALMEETMVPVLTGQISPRVTGRIYCNMIDVSASRADFRQAGEWSDQTMRWCDEQGIAGGFPGICRIRRSEMMRLRGAWSDAEAEARRATEELGDFGPYMAAAYMELGMVRLNLGEHDAAEEDFRKAHALGASPMPGMALLELARGDTGAARSMMGSALDRTDDLLGRAKLLPSAIEISLAAGEDGTAERYSAELAELGVRFDSDLLRIFAVQGSGRVAAAEGRHGDAVVLHQEVVNRLVAYGLPYHTARARCDLALALTADGSVEMGDLELEAAKADFERLGARSDLDRLAAMAEPGPEGATGAVRTMMFTDIVDSTGLVGAIGDAAWADLLAWHDRTLRDLIAEHHGEEIKRTGDGFLATFGSVNDAASCAVAIQRGLRRHRRDIGFSPKVRIGIHAGPILVTDGDIIGHEVHLAARIGSAAFENEILVSQSTVDALRDGFAYGTARDIDAKGIAEPVTVVPLESTEGS